MNLWIQSASRTATAAGQHARESLLLHWLVRLGGLGLFGVAIVDSSVIPLPLPGSTDLLLLLLAAHRHTTVPTIVWLAFCAFAGSMIGGYLTWTAGCKGGEATLERYVPARHLSRVTGWVEKHCVMSVGVAAILPPPLPLSPFLLAAGALGMARGRFLAGYGVARALRYGLLAWLGVTYGRHFVTLWQRELAGWSSVILWTYLGLVVLGILYGLWKWKRGKHSQRGTGSPVQDTA